MLIKFIKEFIKEFKYLILFDILLILINISPISNTYKIILDFMLMAGLIIYIIQVNREINAKMRIKYPDIYKKKEKKLK